MESRPLVFRTVIVAVVVLVFALAMHPLRERDYYEVFLGMLKDRSDKQAAELVEAAKKLQKDDPALFQSQALLQAADSRGIDLTSKIKATGLEDNRDAISQIRKEAASSIRLGLDLAGGVEFLLQLVPDEDFLKELQSSGGSGETREQAESRMNSEFNRYRDVAIETLRKRLEGQKIFEAEIAPSGSRHIALRAPVTSKDEKIKLLELIKMSAKLNFRLLSDRNDELVKAYLADPKHFVVPPECELMTTSKFRPGQPPLVEYFFVNRRVEMTGKGITMAIPTKDEFNQRKIVFRFNTRGAEDFARLTTNNVGRCLAIVLDGKLYSAPRINTPITGGSGEITGSFSEEEAKTVADALVSGSFPFQIKVDAVFDTDPKLGASNVANGIWVGLISLVLVALFMVIYYRASGFIAVTALALNMVLILGAMAAFGSTLTLPGIAGIVLTIGMAVDANVLVYERIREEIESGKSMINAVNLGYDRALSAVLDSNITTLITSIILMNVGTGAVKGFAVTLSIGILTSLFTALFVTRLIYDYLFRFTRFSKVSFLQVFRKSNFNFVRWWPKTLIASAAMAVLTLVIIAVRGTGVLGVDFTGGTVVTFNYAEQVPQHQIEKVLKEAGYDEPSVTYKFNISAAEDDKKVEILIRGDLTSAGASKSPKDELASLLNAKFPNAKFSGGLESSIGGLIGWEFTKAAIWAVVLSFIGIGLYITLRYEYTYAMAGVLSLVHDVMVSLCIYLLLGRTISLTVLAALLTVIGYSINDKVVVFDRIRENIKLKLAPTFTETANMSLNQTLSRTLITSWTTFIVVFMLYIGGGVAINDFVLIMMLGVIFGTYSSMFVAAPLVSYWHRGADKAAAPAKREPAEARGEK